MGWAIAHAAHAGVAVQDTTGCLDPETVELDLRSVLGDEVVDRVSVQIALAGEESWRLQLDVLDGASRSEAIWSRQLEAQPVDCPYLGGLVVLSIERGLATVPGWGLRAERRPPPELGFRIWGTLPWAMQLGMGGVLWLQGPGRVRIPVALDGIWGAVQRLDDGATLQVAGIVATTGAGMEWPMRHGALWTSASTGIGPLFSLGGGTKDDDSFVNPRVPLVTDIGWRSGSPIEITARFELPVIRTRWRIDHYNDTRQHSGAIRYVEPPLRFGLVLSVVGPLRRVIQEERVPPVTAVDLPGHGGS